MDDALGEFACHGVGGMAGIPLLGVLASKSGNSMIGNKQGLIYDDANLFFI